MSMKLSWSIPLWVVVVATLVLWVLVPWASGARPGVGPTDGCVSCHPELKQEMASANAHEPFRKQKCDGCHTVHASKYGHLLKAEPRELCLSCHNGGGRGADGVEHPPYATGDCLKCHDPHASGRKRMLLAEQDALCFGCHDKDRIAKGNLHAPVRKGSCLSCHQAHTSKYAGMLDKPRETLCKGCHADAGEKKGAHRGYSVADTDCVSCHSPHSSPRKALLMDDRHEPFARGQCGACHKQASGGGALRQQGAQLCLRCHEGEAESFRKIVSHAGQGVYCLNCHGPHASERGKLRRSGEERMCLECHSDTAEFVRGANATHKHPLVAEGRCTSCHTPHGSDQPHLFDKGEVGVCTNCHERHAEFTHPIGEDTVDPRSKRDISCITCHNLMGSPYPFALRFDRKKDLCLQCHKGY
ncbi:MAG: cytochrome c3 family protein [Proteobacteria bacterium]|nr:cytochrome c3 family protein [Pseudomonadota bacterium]